MFSKTRCKDKLFLRNTKEKFVVLKIFTIFATLLTLEKSLPMARNGWLYRVYDLYRDGFRQMTLGRTLWAIILIKLFIIFAILKVFFFPNYISTHAEEGKESEFVATKILKQ